MKKLLVLLFIIFIYCKYFPKHRQFNKQPIIITKIWPDTDGYCNYYTTPEYNQFLGMPKHIFINKCGKFNVGDTIKFVK